jgi:hypothetical protein
LAMRDIEAQRLFQLVCDDQVGLLQSGPGSHAADGRIRQ